MNDEIRKVADIQDPNKPTSLTKKLNPLDEAFYSGRNMKYTRFVMAAMGSIPWIGSFISAAASLTAEIDQDNINELLKLWLEDHESKLSMLKADLGDIFSTLENFGDEIKERIESPEYLGLVRTAFRTWDQSDTEEKRQMVKKLITNAGATSVCPDDLIRLFIKWIENYHESHFMVIKEIYQHPQITRETMWDHLHATRPREDSAEADLFKYLIRDLSTGGVIRQTKDKNDQGEYLKNKPQHVSKGFASTTMESAFEDTKPYELTKLGEEFIHHVLNDAVLRLNKSETPDA